jgi:hypothetical protein
VHQKLFNLLGRHGGFIGHQEQKTIGMLGIEFRATYMRKQLNRINQV